MPFFWSYLSHFILDLDGVKSKVGLLNPCNLSNYIASPPVMPWLTIIFLVISQPLQVKFWWCEKQSWSLIYSTSIYQTQFNRPIILHQIYWIKICQAQFKFSPSSVQFELRLSLKPGYYHPPTNTHPPSPTHPPTHPHPPPPGKVEIQLEIDYIWSVDRWGMVWLTFMRLLG